MELDATATGWRLIRAIGFALTAAVLGILGHRQESGVDVPLSVLVLVAAAAGVVGWWLSADERGAVATGAGVLGVQLALHLALTVGGQHVAVPHGASQGMAGAMGGMDPGRMAALHLASAVLAAWWLRRSERVVFTTARVCSAVRDRTALVWVSFVPRPAPAARIPRERPVAFREHPVHSVMGTVGSIGRRGPPAPLAA